MNTKALKVTSFIAAAGMMLAACAQPTPAVVEKIVEKPVEVVKEVVKEVPKEVVKEVVKEVAAPVKDRIPIRWYVGLGTGSDKDQIPVQKAFEDKFNKSQDEIELRVEIVTNGGGTIARDNLKAQIAAGNAPDIVGPVGKYGRAQFKGAWLDVDPLIKENNIDLTKIDPALIEFAKDEGVLVGLPYALFPSFTFFNKDLFDEAKLPYPPQEIGGKYKFPDGTEKEWNLDTYLELARLLTIDKAGKDATQPGFDPKSIVQWGYAQQWNNARAEFTLYGGPGTLIAEDGSAKIPDNWKAAAKLWYDGMWKNNSMANGPALSGELLSTPNAFASGNVAMTWTHTWYMCCVASDKNKNWSVAAPPLVNGKPLSKMHGDTFAIMKDTKNAKAAFKAMQAIMADKDLQVLYNGLPAVAADRPEYYKRQNETRKLAEGQVNWGMIEKMLAYPDVPNHEAWMPNMIKAEDRINAFQTLLQTKSDVNVDAELAKLETELTAIFKEAK
jgi:multiple sugar transport system substrate-binding protein